MLRVGIVDDEPHSLDSIKDFIGSIPGYEITLATGDPDRVLDAAERKEIDIVITDIKMPGIDGVILSDILRELKIPVIICSAYPERALECIKTQVVDFIVKPPNKLKVFRGLNIAKERLDRKIAGPQQEHQPFILVSKFGNRNLRKLPVDQIIYVEQKSNYAIIYLEDEQIVYRSAFRNLFKLLESHDFFRTHRSFAFNAKYFKKIENDRIFLSNGAVLPIGRSFSKILPPRISQYLSDQSN